MLWKKGKWRQDSHTREMTEWEEQKVEDQRVGDNWPSDKGQRHQVFAAAERVWSHSEKVSWEGRKSKTPERLVEHWYWTFCGDLTFGEIKKDMGIFLGWPSGEMEKENVRYSLRMKLMEVSNPTADTRSHILITPYTHWTCSPIQGIYRLLGDAQEKHCFLRHSLFSFGQTWKWCCLWRI